MRLNAIIPTILAFITQKGRYRPQLNWSTGLWTCNVFRLYEMIFWRRYGIRVESAYAFDRKGLVSRTAYSWEARLAFLEVDIRAFFKKLSYVRLVVQEKQLALYPIGRITIGYSFAIAFDTAAGGTDTATLAMTTTGSNLDIVCSIIGQTGASYTPVFKWNTSETFTIANSIQLTSDRWTFTALLGTATAATSTIDVTNSTFREVFATSYSGAQASSTVDSTATSNSTDTSYVQTTTVVASNCWLVGFVYGWTTALAGAGTVLRGAALDSARMADSNGTVGTGSQSLNWTLTVSQQKVGEIISIGPFVAPSGPANLKTYDTNVKANIKSMNTNLIANVKTFDTNA